ncbi:34-kDa subunit of RNA polymerase III (C) [Polyrhizophydium stewartii]|uniref:DNA-directed RNA polymerase III subunit RPC6 n=1 Tax=Polyrhizophydium stewartii TaxID=2732419 RepID=A0ABR4MYD1_9FUNG
MGPPTLSQTEQTLLVTLRKFPKGTNHQALLDHLQTWTETDIVEGLNSLSSKHFVDFLESSTQGVIFRARDAEEATKWDLLDRNAACPHRALTLNRESRRTGSMNEQERIVYQFIKASSNKGTWVKDIKVKSGLHGQVVAQAIKSLEKKSLIKAVKSVKTPTKKVYMLAEIEPSAELTGGAWYTDQELDVEFIDQLSNQLFKYIGAKSIPPDPQFIYPSSHPFPTCADLHRWISKSGITTVELSRADVQSLLDRLVFDSKIEQIPIGGTTGNDDDDEDLDEWNMDEDSEDVWAYRASRRNFTDGSAWTDVPCGRCPVFSFCKEGGPVSPSGCVYFKKWLEY